MPPQCAHPANLELVLCNCNSMMPDITRHHDVILDSFILALPAALCWISDHCPISGSETCRLPPDHEIWKESGKSYYRKLHTPIRRVSMHWKRVPKELINNRISPVKWLQGVVTYAFPRRCIHLLLACEVVGTRQTSTAYTL